MAIGDKIKKIRVKRDMTQKELGLAIGFNDKTADVRMAQYESGTRVPKEAVIIKIAAVLKVNPDYLMAPTLTKTEEIIHTLIYLDEYNQLKMQAEEYTTPEGENQKIINLSITAVDYYLEEWYDKKRALENNEITQEEYYEWKINWPDSSERYRKTFPEFY
ncbi:helix-turn-helix domain-containing protein [Oceanirhabdus seepicola]|uniref:Helix-turn-helix transcriptional regulator n=1 Tax=Oceanirhabdus seepicola TaxID=2828781 RepID=A0A9J6P278_9CLOT|nr:helix-turn-helix transcriptional regulator [Oceanirhabdus seepicola]MCM1990161.1 helix-turn-helix transcriptional regulator [Oceanirhabdus seepicola]